MKWKIPTVKLPMMETPVEYPVSNAVYCLWEEHPISSGFMAELNQRWTIIFRGIISDKAKEAAKGAGLKVTPRPIKGTLAYFTDVYLPAGTIADFEKAKLAFDEFASRYSGLPKYLLPIAAPKEYPTRIEE